MRDDQNRLIETGEFDPESTPASAAVVCTVAGVLNAQPRELDPIWDAVDADALDALFDDRTKRADAVTFEYHGYVVTVQGSGEIALKKTDGEGSEPACRN